MRWCVPESGFCNPRLPDAKILAINTPGAPLMSAENQIRDTIQLYFDGMYESSAEKTIARFIPTRRSPATSKMAFTR